MLLITLDPRLQNISIWRFTEFSQGVSKWLVALYLVEMDTYSASTQISSIFS